MHKSLSYFRNISLEFSSKKYCNDVLLLFAFEKKIDSKCPSILSHILKTSLLKDIYNADEEIYCTGGR